MHQKTDLHNLFSNFDLKNCIFVTKFERNLLQDNRKLIHHESTDVCVHACIWGGQSSNSSVILFHFTPYLLRLCLSFNFAPFWFDCLSQKAVSRQLFPTSTHNTHIECGITCSHHHQQAQVFIRVLGFGIRPSHFHSRHPFSLIYFPSALSIIIFNFMFQ